MDFFGRKLRKSDRLLKKLHMQGVEEQGMRRTSLYAAMTSDADNDADGLFQQPVQEGCCIADNFQSLPISLAKVQYSVNSAASVLEPSTTLPEPSVI